MKKAILFFSSIILLLACTDNNNKTSVIGTDIQKMNSSEQNLVEEVDEIEVVEKKDTLISENIIAEKVEEPVVYNEYTFVIKDLSTRDSSTCSIVVYKNNEVYQKLELPKYMDIEYPFDRRFFTAKDVNFDGYDDLYFTDFMAMVNGADIVYLYNQSTQKFQLNEDYSSICSPQYDIDHQIIKSFGRGSAAYHEAEVYVVLNNQLTRISRVVDDQGSNVYQYIVYDGEKQVAVNESLRRVKLNIAFFKTQKFNIIIDLLDSGKYRYASWGITRDLRNNPDLILENGVKNETDNEVLYTFTKGEFSYVCVFNKLTNQGGLKVFQNKKEIVNQDASVFIVPNEVKTYKGNKKNKITLDIQGVN